MNIIDGGVTAPKGYMASGVSSGVKKSGAPDLALLSSNDTAAVSGVYTTNRVKGHSLQLTMEHAKNGYARAVVINSGNANACVGEQGYKNAAEISEFTAKLLQCDSSEVLVGSTGVIGLPLNMPLIRSGIRQANAALSTEGGHNAQRAIMTTDLLDKEIAVSLEIQGEEVRIGAMAKGSGMIHPNMATMICIITTDANISKSLLDVALKQVVGHTFNRVSVDGDTSVCDMVLLFANGESENPGIVKNDIEFEYFVKALDFVCTTLAKKIVQDGEGATKFVEINAEGANSADDAYKLVNTIAKSPLVKTALFGEDANWGRIINAAGYSGAEFDPNLVDIYICGVLVCRNGSGTDFSEEAVKKLLQQKEITIKIDVKKGTFKDKIWTCDFSYDYVKINGSYRS
ncbi:MAG: bifunctional glutamate N-acetyltransferase/amino-acid acetyltransferase ArgJ [Clostridia bacterium]|jgi:glutamate N-acetyltransferase/amino-acid N-acetyltransferase